MTTALTIQETASLTGLSVHTLRYYERIGLIHPIPRKNNRHRLYRAEDIGWIEFILRLRATGMPISKMQRYAQLRHAGDQRDSVSERKAMLEQHALTVEAEIASLTETLAYLRTKVQVYADIEKKLAATEKSSTREGKRHAGNTI
jgi:DNA-binding transcriptional MerR regulator